MDIYFDYRLSKNILPISYNITIEPTAPDYNFFQGTCTIIYETIFNINKIILHAFDLEIASVFIMDDNIFEPAKEIIYNKSTQQVKFVFNNIIPNTGVLIIDYLGKIYTNIPSAFFKVREENEWVMYTHFEPICARKCFPCFDEPAFKARFNLEIITLANKTVISNTDIIQKINMDDKIKYIFAETPIMSSYLLAFYIGNIEYSQDTTSSGITVRIYDPCQIKREYILKQAIQILDFLTEFMGIPYALNKLDYVFVPKLEGQAMENWGLITHIQESSRKKCKNDTDIEVFLTLAHEIAHQWFGNLITMDWWSEAWLNESFASWISYYVANNFFPEKNIWEYFFLRETVQSLQDDILVNSKPIRAKIDNIEDINQSLSGTLYSKGAVFINMLVKYLGIDAFRDGMRHCINKYKYQAINTIEFFESFEKHISNDIILISSKWINEPNYPIINISVNDKQIKLLQEQSILDSRRRFRFFAIWFLNITDTVSIYNHTTFLPLTKIHQELNHDSTGLYLCFYSYETLFNMLKHNDFRLNTNYDNSVKKYSDIYMAQILFTIFMMLRFDRIAFHEFTDLLELYLQRQPTHNPSYIITDILKQITKYLVMNLDNQKLFQSYNKILSSYIGKIIKTQGLLPEKEADNFENKSKIDIFQIACLLKIPDVVDFAINMVEQYITQCDNYTKDHQIEKQENIFHRINSEIRSSIIQLAITENNISRRKTLFDSLIAKIDKPCKTRPSIKGNLYRSLAKTPDYDNYLRVLELTLKTDISTGNIITIFRSAVTNKKYDPYVWQFIKKNWDNLYYKFKNTQSEIYKFIKILSCIRDIKHEIKSDIYAFFKHQKLMARVGKTLPEILEIMEMNTAFTERFYQEFWD